MGSIPVSSSKIMEEATELEFLQWFYSNADFGPADEDVRLILQQRFEQETGKKVPEGYGRE